MSTAPPETPNSNPPILKPFNDSFKNHAANNVIVIGVLKSSNEAWIGVVNEKPSMVNVWFIVIPNKAQNAKRRKSFLVIPIFTGLIAYMDQNNNIVTMMRKAVNANGGIREGVMCFTAITLVPKKKLASNTPVLAFVFSFMICGFAFIFATDSQINTAFFLC